MCKIQTATANQTLGASVTPSLPATAISSPSIYKNLDPNASTDNLATPNAAITPSVAHAVYGVDPNTLKPGSLSGIPDQSSAPAADGDETWYCCSCRSGPYLVALYPQCMNCNHSRCYYCKIE